VNRVAISDKRIVAVDEQTVTYRYTPSGESRSKVRTVSGTEFVRGFVQHTLPRRFQKVRYYGWMRNGKRRIQRDEVKWLVYMFLGWMYWLATAHAPQVTAKPPSTVRCAECGEAMHVVEVTYQPVRTLSEHALAYLDSG
jgi:hypothetical protein